MPSHECTKQRDLNVQAIKELKNLEGFIKYADWDAVNKHLNTLGNQDVEDLIDQLNKIQTILTN